MRMIRIVCVAGLLVGLGCQGMKASRSARLSPESEGLELTRFDYRQFHMGVEAALAFYAPDSALAERAAGAAFARMARIEQVLSDYRVDSEVMQLQRAARPGVPVRVSEDLFAVLDRSLALSRETNGAFDVMAGALTHLWREARRRRALPEDEALARARERSGWRHVTLDSAARTVTVDVEGLQFDFGGIGKGFAADEALRVLRAHGIVRALVSIAGDVAMGDRPPQEDGWWIRTDVEDAMNHTLIMHNEAISTSGDTYQFLEIGGTRYSHIIDPRTGRPLVHGLAVTVRAPRATDADAFATAASVLGERERAAFIASHPEATFYVRRADCPEGTTCR